MSRMAVIIGRDEKGDLVTIGRPAEGDALQALRDVRNVIRDAKGIVPQGLIRGVKGEVKLTEMRVLSNHTSSGELFGPCRW